MTIEERFQLTIKEILKQLKELPFFDKIEQVILFGSFTKKTYRADSDIDLLIETREQLSKQEILTLKTLYCETEKALELDIKVRKIGHTFGNAIEQEIQKDGVPLWKRNADIMNLQKKISNT